MSCFMTVLPCILSSLFLTNLDKKALAKIIKSRTYALMALASFGRRCSVPFAKLSTKAWIQIISATLMDAKR